MPGESVHILFNTSAASSLQHALVGAGREDEVLHLPDDLSYGSIRSIDPDARRQSLVREGFAAPADELDWLVELSDEFWAKCEAADRQRILWVAGRCGEETAGLLAYLDRFGDIPCRIVRIEEVEDRLPREEFPDGPVLRSGRLWQHHFAALLGAHRPLRQDEAQAARQLWRRLAGEDAALRVPGEQGLVLAPDDLLDEYLLRETVSKWRTPIRIMAGAMGLIWQERGHAVSLTYLAWRLKKLVASGLLESRDDISAWSLFQEHEQETKIRRRAA